MKNRILSRRQPRLPIWTSWNWVESSRLDFQKCQECQLSILLRSFLHLEIYTTTAMSCVLIVSLSLWLYACVQATSITRVCAPLSSKNKLPTSGVVLVWGYNALVDCSFRRGIASCCHSTVWESSATRRQGNGHACIVCVLLMVGIVLEAFGKRGSQRGHR